MKTEAFPITFFANNFKDFKAEVTAAEIIELGTPPDHILILMLGAKKRAHRKDVLSIEEELSKYDHKEYIIVKTPKEGLYDMLPEGLFHNPSAHKSVATEEEIIKAIKQRKEEEQNARRFFIPFEAAINFPRMKMALYENRLDKRIHHDELLQIFTEHWEIFELLDARQADIFLHLLPILHHLRDDHPAIEMILEMMFGLPVQLILQPQIPLHPAAPITSSLGTSSLGIDFTTGNELYDEKVEEIIIRFGPLYNEAFQAFRPGNINFKILEKLIDYLLPVHLDNFTEFVLNDQDKILKLATEDFYLNSVLGTDTYL